MNDCLDWRIYFFLENLIVTISCKRTGYRHVDVSIRADDVTDRFFELVIGQELITFFNFIVANLSISNQNNVLDVFTFDLLGNNWWWCSSSSLSFSDETFKIFFCDCWERSIPQVESSDLGSIKCNNLTNCVPVIFWAANWARDIKEKLILVLLYFRLHQRYFIFLLMKLIQFFYIRIIGSKLISFLLLKKYEFLLHQINLWNSFKYINKFNL